MKRLFLLKILLDIYLTLNIFLLFSQSILFDSIACAYPNDDLKETTSKTISEFEIVANSIKTEGEERIIFEGKVRLRYDSSTNFFADKVIVDFSLGGEIKCIQILGNVSMTKVGVTISSQEAFPDDFKHYVDFTENISVFPFTGVTGRIKPGKLRYYFKSGEIQLQD